MYSFGYGNYHIVSVRKGFFYIGNKFVLVEIHLRQIYELRRCIVLITCERGSGSEPSCVTSHDFNDCHTLNSIDKGVMGYLKHARCDVFGGRAKSRSVVCHAQVIVDGLWNSYNFHITVDFFCIIG